MAIGKEVLNQYLSEKKEIEELYEKIDRYDNKIARLQNRIAEIEEGHTVKDKVYGGEGGLQSFIIEGVPLEEYNDKKLDLEHAKRIYAQTQEMVHIHEMNLILRTKEVEKYILTINDSVTRRIVSARVLDGLTWQQVAQKIGGGNSESSVKMIWKRYFDKKN